MDLKKIEEEIRQYKLYKIQTTESKIREYKSIHNRIKENIVVKFTKNSFSNLIFAISTLVSISLFVIAITLVFPEISISIIEKHQRLSENNRDILIKVFPYIGYIALMIGVFFSFISSLLIKNNRKRNIIYKLSKLVDEVITYMNDNAIEEKKKYEHFMDNIADIEITKKRNENNKTTKRSA